MENEGIGPAATTRLMPPGARHFMNTQVSVKSFAPNPQGHNEELTNYPTVASYIQSIFVSRRF